VVLRKAEEKSEKEKEKRKKRKRKRMLMEKKKLLWREDWKRALEKEVERKE
jgi:hypothetical protein